MAFPRVSVVTPTWDRHRLLLERCIPSVLAQEYPSIEHIVVSDGPDLDLKLQVRLQHPGVVYAELPAHDGTARWGHHARVKGTLLARGEFIAYLDDDNAFRPEHVGKLVAALDENPGAGFAYSKIQMRREADGQSYVVGADPPVCGQIDTSAIMHRRSLLRTAAWRDEGQVTIDWDLVERWMAAGVRWAHVPEVTADYYFT